MDFEVKLTDIFEGPMDLLLYLVRKQELDICNLPLSIITQQFLEFTKVLEFLDFNEIGEFLWVAPITAPYRRLEAVRAEGERPRALVIA